jgi:hypothetical protein
LANLHDERWKLHVQAPGERRDVGSNGQPWVDPRAPDGVTILAPYEQHQPTDFPGLRTGDASKPMALFDLSNDPGEQHNVADQNPDVVKRLKALFDGMELQVPAPLAKKQAK